MKSWDTMQPCWQRSVTGCSGSRSILQVLVAFAVLMAIGLAPLVLWLGYAVATTRDDMQADRDRTRQ